MAVFDLKLKEFCNGLEVGVVRIKSNDFDGDKATAIGTIIPYLNNAIFCGSPKDFYLIYVDDIIPTLKTCWDGTTTISQGDFFNDDELIVNPDWLSCDADTNDPRRFFW